MAYTWVLIVEACEGVEQAFDNLAFFAVLVQTELQCQQVCLLAAHEQSVAFLGVEIRIVFIKPNHLHGQI